MKGVINGVKWIIDFFKTIFSIISNIIKGIGTAFTYLITIVQIALNVLSTLPTWLISFGMITISISIIYFIIGRNTGKSD